MKNRKNLFGFSFALVLMISACGPTAADQSTQVAQTVIAEITETALANPTDTLEPPTNPPEPTEISATETAAPTGTTVPTATNTEIPSPTATATFPAGDPALSLGAPTSILGFAPNNWFLYEDDHIKMDIVDGQLELIAFAPESWEGWSTTGIHLENFYLQVTGTTGDVCAGRDRFGMIVRADDPNEGYLFGISCDGFFRLRSWDGEVFTTLINWTASSHIRVGPNETNRIGFMARGTELRLFINGVEVGVIEDGAFDQGAFGVFASSSATVDFMITISDVRYWKLP